MTQGAQLRSGGSDDERNFYITFLARSFVLRHMTVTSNEQGRRANDERRSCRSIVLDFVQNKFPEDVFFGGVVVSTVIDRAVSSA